MRTQALLFISFEKHLASQIMGGVQICTKEYLDLFISGGFEIHIKAVPFTHNFVKRLKLKLGIDVYEGYDFETIAQEVIAIIKQKQISIVAINQVSLMGLAPILRRAFGDTVKIIVLSHGNESGDFLHEIVLQKTSLLTKWVRMWRLGAFLTKESIHFRNDIDVVLCLSETEQHINNWLGVNQTIFIPRTFKPRFLNWQPVKGRIGFVGTLDHLPNYQGLTLFLDELVQMSLEHIHVRIVGGPAVIGQALQKKYPFVEYLGKLDAASLEAEAATWGVFINPIFWYSRGASTKLAQGINWGLPIITTPAGNRGYILNKEDLVTVYTPKEMAEKAKFYLTDEACLITLALGTRAVAMNGPTYHQIIDSILPVIYTSSSLV